MNLNIYLLDKVVCPDLIIFGKQGTFSVKFIVTFHPGWSSPRAGKQFDRLVAQISRPVDIWKLWENNRNVKNILKEY